VLFLALVDVVKYDGTPDVFAWKYPSDDLGTWTQLIVNESQEAVLYKGGQALDLFGSGRHTLTTMNIPILNGIMKLPFGGESPFKAEVWYVNKVNSLDIKWGTPSPIQLQDPKYNVFIPLRSFGQFGIQIEDSRKFLVKLVGTLKEFDKESIIRYFRGLYLTRVKDCISSYLVHKAISVLEINAYLDEISDELMEKMVPVLGEYGIKLVNFYVNDINVPEDDASVIKLKEALAKRAEMDIVGYSYAQERSFDTLEGAATNQGAANMGMMGAGMGLGIGVGMGGGLGQQFSDMTQNINTNQQNQGNPVNQGAQSTAEMKVCSNCNNSIAVSQKFCGHCGFDTSVQNVEDNSESGKVVCSSCENEYSNSVKFCPHCGNKYEPCPKCGADLKEGASACHLCGHMLPKPCPGCGHKLDNPNAKFCPECGQSLEKRCPSCNAKIEGSPKFCSECGNNLI
jgi:membrane protease subunit (stomatin/prohibitin family)